MRIKHESRSSVRGEKWWCSDGLRAETSKDVNANTANMRPAASGGEASGPTTSRASVGRWSDHANAPRKASVSIHRWPNAMEPRRGVRNESIGRSGSGGMDGIASITPLRSGKDSSGMVTRLSLELGAGNRLGGSRSGCREGASDFNAGTDAPPARML